MYFFVCLLAIWWVWVVCFPWISSPMKFPDFYHISAVEDAVFANMQLLLVVLKKNMRINGR